MNYTYEKSYSQLDAEFVSLKKVPYLGQYSVLNGIICFTFGMNIVKIKTLRIYYEN